MSLRRAVNLAEVGEEGGGGADACEASRVLRRGQQGLRTEERRESRF